MSESHLKGYLFRKNSNGEWKKRFCEVNGCFLTLYSNSKEEKVVAVVDLEQMSSVDIIESASSQSLDENIFAICLSEGKTFELSASTPEEATNWVQHIASFRERLDNIHFSPNISSSEAVVAEEIREKSVENSGKSKSSSSRHSTGTFRPNEATQPVHSSRTNTSNSRQSLGNSSNCKSIVSNAATFNNPLKTARPHNKHHSSSPPTVSNNSSNSASSSNTSNGSSNSSTCSAANENANSRNTPPPPIEVSDEEVTVGIPVAECVPFSTPLPISPIYAGYEQVSEKIAAENRERLHLTPLKASMQGAAATVSVEQQQQAQHAVVDRPQPSTVSSTTVGAASNGSSNSGGNISGNSSGDALLKPQADHKSSPGTDRSDLTSSSADRNTRNISFFITIVALFGVVLFVTHKK